MSRHPLPGRALREATAMRAWKGRGWYVWGSRALGARWLCFYGRTQTIEIPVEPVGWHRHWCRT